MPEIKLLEYESVSLRSCGIDEYWVQQYIAEHPSKLGLGNLTLVKKERRQAQGGRLDLLLANYDDEPDQRYYEVEVQLGKTDESHIIRCIEYWDNERKTRALSQYDHVAVLVSEDPTSRFFNVIQLFNRHIPVVAVKMVASKLGDGLVLQFIKVLDETSQSLEEEEERAAPQVNREWWDKRSSKQAMQVLDSLLKILADFDEHVQFYYTQSYVRPQVGPGDRLPLWIRPKAKFVRVSVHFANPQDATDWKAKLEGAGLEEVSDSRRGSVRFRLTQESLERNAGIVREILKEASTGD